MELTRLSLNEQGQLLLNLVLLWMGMALLIGLAARWIVPGKPLGPFATLLLGMISATVGCYGMRLFFLHVFGDSRFNPISLAGIFSGILVAVLLLGTGRFCLMPFKKK